MSITEIIAYPLGYLMYWCLGLVKNYGLAILLFTLLTKVLLMPLTLWVHKNSIKMIRIKPELNMIQARNAGNLDTMMDLQKKLYKKEHYRPFAGIIPMIIQIIFVLGLINVIYNPMTHILHLGKDVISALLEKAVALSGGAELGSSAQLTAINFIKDAGYTGEFASLAVAGAGEAVQRILGLDMTFGPLILTAKPSFFDPAMWQNLVNIMPFVSGASAFALSYAENKINVLQQEGSWFSRWGMAIFLTLFSFYFACIVPSGVALYWVAGNLMAILLMFFCNWIIPPKKYIDYEALEESKRLLEISKEAEKERKLTKEDKARAKADYKRFCDSSVKKKVLFYSERSGYFRYFSSIIDEILKKTDYDIHYLTSDPKDAIFNNDNERIIKYFLDDNRLIPAFMRVDSDVMLMTMPDIDQFHLKRSYIRKDTEYIYVYHAMVVGPRTVRKGATEHYDTLLCTGPKHAAMEKRLEDFYSWKPRKILEIGYPLLDSLIESYENMPKEEHDRNTILIAPSYQDDNILDLCLKDLLSALSKGDYKVIVRPHPQYIKLHPERINEIRTMLADDFEGKDIELQTDFSNNTSVYSSDMLVTDWSSIAYEFAFTTKKPVLFIDTPVKTINEDYADCDYEDAPEVALRNVVGRSLKPEEVADKAFETCEYMFGKAAEFEKVISDIVPDFVCNIGHSAEAAADYIISAVERIEKESKYF